MQFDYNLDLATLPASEPLEFPPADPRPCARITTRVYHPSRDAITTVQNVLVPNNDAKADEYFNNVRFVFVIIRRILHDR
jgi:hypothetical protein